MVSVVSLAIALRHGSADQQISVDHVVNQLATTTRRRWRQQSALHRLTGDCPLRVQWESVGGPAAATAETVLGSTLGPGRPLRLRLHGDISALAEVYRKIPTRQLVVLGGPGSGKTVTALVLVGDLIENWQPGCPVPVLLAMADWNPDVSLRTWVAGELRSRHRWMGGRLATRLVDEGQVVAVLDGFDEMPSRRRTKAIGELNKAAIEGLPLVVTSRRGEYIDAVTGMHDPLDRAVVMVLKAVETDQVERFLTNSNVDGSRRWKDIVAHLHANPHGSLSRLLATPLMAHMARTVFSSGPAHPNVLLNLPTNAEMERHLLNAYLPALYGAGSGAASKAHRWLSNLAGRLNRHGCLTFNPESLPIRTPAWVSLLGSVVAIIFTVSFYFVYIPFLALGAALGFVVAPLLTFAYLGMLLRFMTRRHIGSRLLMVAASPLLGLAGGAALLGTGAALLVGGVVLQTGKVIGGYGIYIWLAIRGEIPCRWRRFVRDAHKRGILRRTSSGYEFRHLRIQDHLAGTVGEPSYAIEPDCGVAVLERLGDQRSRALLIAMASDQSSRLRLVAAKALVELGDPRGPEALFTIAMNPRDTHLHLLAALELTHLDDARVPDLLASIAADDQQVGTRCRAAATLTRLGDPRGMQMLVQLAANADTAPQTRIQAATVLAAEGHSYGRDALAEYVAEFRGSARDEAVKALLQLRDPRGCNALVAIAANPAEGSEDRLSAAKTLGSFVAAQGHAALAALAGDTTMSPEDRIAAHRAAKKLRRHGALARTEAGVFQ